jgi:hypothetical protein
MEKVIGLEKKQISIIGYFFRLPHINLFRWKFLPPFAKEQLLCKVNGLEEPAR